MVQNLSAIFGNDKVNYQECARSGRMDIVVDGKYAIELKVISAPSQLKRLMGQVISYSEEYEKLFVWLFDQKNQLKTTDVNDFKRLMKKSNVKNMELIIKN